jgi:hypothetical protein
MKSLLFLLLIVINLSVSGQQKQISLPFKLTKFNIISIPAILNNSDTVNLMFHTAASSVTLIESAVAKIKTLSFTYADSVQSWGGKNKARVSENNTLQIGGIQFSNISIWENKYSAQETDGKFGLDLFKNKYIKIDFNRKVMVISSALPGNIKKYKKLNLVFENDMMFLKANIKIGDTVLEDSFLIHSGYSGSILLNDLFVKNNRIDTVLTITGEKKLLDSYGNAIKSLQGILPELTIGTVKLFDIQAGFFSGSLGAQELSIIGADILKRFSIIIDAKREYIYLKSNKQSF